MLVSFVWMMSLYPGVSDFINAKMGAGEENSAVYFFIIEKNMADLPMNNPSPSPLNMADLPLNNLCLSPLKEHSE